MGRRAARLRRRRRIALRLPEAGQRFTTFAIEDENTEFRLAGDPTRAVHDCDNFTTSHEALYERKPLVGAAGEKAARHAAAGRVAGRHGGRDHRSAAAQFCGHVSGAAEATDDACCGAGLSPLPGQGERGRRRRKRRTGVRGGSCCWRTRRAS